AGWLAGGGDGLGGGRDGDLVAERGLVEQHGLHGELDDGGQGVGWGGVGGGLVWELVEGARGAEGGLDAAGEQRCGGGCYGAGLGYCQPGCRRDDPFPPRRSSDLAGWLAGGGDGLGGGRDGDLVAERGLVEQHGLHGELDDGGQGVGWG